MIRNMKKLFKKKKNKQQAGAVQSSRQQDPLKKDMNQNVETLRAIYNNCSDVVFHEFHIFGQIAAMLIYIEGLSNTELLDQHVLRPLLQQEGIERKEHVLIKIKSHVSVSNIKNINLISDCIESLSTGNPVLLIEGESQALSLGLTKFETRSIEEPQAEKVIRGPREGFIESLQVNTSMLRRVIKSPALKIKSRTIGEYTRTNVALIYIEGIVSPSLIEEMEKRLKRIQIDGALESNYIEEMIEDNPYSPFPQILSTERPDVVSAHLLEGRAAILTEGSPFALIAPVSLFSMLQAPDDYYERSMIASIIRWVRYIFIFLSLMLPALYVGITTFHQEMIPHTLLLSIAAARETVPFPALVEVLLMELMFEALRQAGIRLPNQIGSAVSIVGGLVIGQASVEAGLVSAPMIIIVATTGIASFLVPRYIIGFSFRYLRFPMIVFAGALGLLGIMMGLLAIIIHLCTLRSFGEPYLQPLAPLKKRELKDTLWRAPLWKMNTRPEFNNEINPKRQAQHQKPGPPKEGEKEG